MNRSSSGLHLVGILPARWGSSRFPGKPLHLLAGKPLIQHVWERCLGCTKLDELYVATDDDRIRDAVLSFGGKVLMTSPDHPTGTDRLAEAVKALPQATHVINIQGDEPLIDPALIDDLAAAMIADPELPMATAANVIEDEEAISDPNVVKVVLDATGHALYFSRSPIPYRRTVPAGLAVYRHKGLYGYKRDFLERFVTWPPSVLEQTESLEQLRALENGARIKVLITEDDSIGLDTPEQAPLVESLLLSSR
ncbi:3-deoxy-manno-octulosonate cytidylyltransferase [Luteolibacter sp. LG18]|uniref:3-deoxy-manno-octulosonate cytidylyltransferase n=1 Tax=Luteolibacter sp. LG18 TaxID=2819286 RepID=UPI002B3238B0|nr:3-deoxy-manno-octulosonate cytidylyltransferase [Luteolibacter sp. LG18]